MIFIETPTERTSNELEKFKELRRLIQSSNDLRIGTEDVFLSKYLNFTNWNVTKAYEAIHKYYDFKLHHPKWVAQNPVTYFRDHFFNTQSKFVLPQADKEGRVVIVMKTIDAFDRYPNFLYDLIEMDDLIFEALLLLPRVQEYGITVICDLRQATKKFLRTLTPSFMKLVNYKHDVLPFKNRVMHIIQRGFVMNATANLLLPFMSKDFKATLSIHDGKNFDKLRNMIGYDCLPAEYGGAPENVLDVNVIYNYLLENAKYLEQLQGYKKIKLFSSINNN